MRLEHWWYTVPLRLRSLFRGGRVEQELDEELRYHVERLTEEQLAKGLTPEDARHAALRAMDGLAQRQEQCRDTRRMHILDDLLKDLRYAVRILRRSPGFTAVVVLSLTLGIGANTAIFQLLDALRLRPLPVNAPGDLADVRIANQTPFAASGYFNGRYPNLTSPQWERIRADQQAFSGMFAWSTSTFDLAIRGESRFAENGLWVSGNFFTLLGVRPVLGRVFTDADDVRGCGSPGVVLSHAFWQRAFGGEASVIGRQLTLDGHPVEIIGVTPARFFGIEVGRSFDFAIPLCADAIINGDGSRLDQPSTWWLAAMGRLKPGWSLARATAHLDAISAGLFQATLPGGYSAPAAQTYLAFRLGAFPGASGVSTLRQQYDTPLWLLLSIAGVALLIACANLANLMMARAGAREREIVVRLALGASRGRLIRQLLVEGLLLAALGATCAEWLAPVLSHAVISLISSPVSPVFVDLGTDWRVLAFTASLAALTCASFALAPALRATRIAPEEALRAGARGVTAGPARFSLRRGLVIAQIALSLVLLVSGLLFVRTLVNLLTIDAGFQQEGILEADVDMTRPNLSAERRYGLRQELIDHIRAVPGVDAAASVSTIPLVGGWRQAVYLAGKSAEIQRHQNRFSRVSSGYFSTLNIPLVAGRDFDEHDRPATPRVAIVNESFATHFLHGANPLGQTFQLDGPNGQPDTVYQIVGLAKNTKYGSLREPFQPIVYLAVSQVARPGPFDQILVRSTMPGPRLMASVKRAIEEANPDIAFHFHDFQEQLRYSLLQERLMATLCGFFALLAAILASIGVYGVMSYSVTLRTNEIGIRLALGADRRAIHALILGEAATLLGIGLTVGATLALISTKAAGALLFGLQPNDPPTLIAATALLASVAAAASYVPARRASTVDPMVALRRE